jgi:hypothetical protein
LFVLFYADADCSPFHL